MELVHNPVNQVHGAGAWVHRVHKIWNAGHEIYSSDFIKSKGYHCFYFQSSAARWTARSTSPYGVAAPNRARRRHLWSSPELGDPVTPRLGFQWEMAQNEERAMGVLTLCLLRHGTMTRWCTAGHLASRARASATSGTEVSLTRTRGVEALGNPGGPSWLDGGARVALLQLDNGDRSKASLRQVSVLKRCHWG
jgi:hypothetical protein